MQPPFPAPVKEWHNETYDAILPTRPELSAAGKNIVITGGGSGIGQEVARTFATAGAESIHLIGRRQQPLEETKNSIESEFPSTKVTTHSADVTDEKSMKAAAEKIGPWDVYVANAGYLPANGGVDADDFEDWWRTFEINVKGTAIAARALLPSRKPNAALVASSSAVVAFPASAFEAGSAYIGSKMAMTKFFEYVTVEYPDLQVVIIHPGVIATDMGHKSGKLDVLPNDDIKLPAHFTLWAASPEAAFARGRFIWCNWDVEELKTLAPKFKEDPEYMSTGIHGYSLLAH